ncbi:efflux RND transporter permease subunit [Puteibacter caeruleilacunae]|nr:efflux RND transporter permease subunit [Puteibacter caeruleilacunae]
MQLNQRRHIPSFTLLMTCLALTLLGLVIVPLLDVSLSPSRNSSFISVGYSYSGANAIVVDSEITSKLEGILSQVEGLKKITSRSGNGNGYIGLQLNKDVDMDAARFEVSTLIRQVYPQLPVGVSYPDIRASGSDDEKTVEQLLSFTLNGAGRRWEVGNVAESTIKPRLSLLNGVHEVIISGYTPLEWNLIYDYNKLKQLNLTPDDISRQIRSYYRSASIGAVKQLNGNNQQLYSTPVVLQGLDREKPQWDRIQIEAGGRLFKLTDLVSQEKKESLPSSYYRINGLNTVNIRVMTTADANQLVVGDQIKREIEKISEELPKGYSLATSYDGTVFIKDELQNIVFRIALSLLLLFVFVWIVSRSWRYVGILLVSLIANIFIAFIFYYWFNVEIQIYSLAGITISLGMIIDNTIVMVDHIRIGKGVSIFRGILAATLTTCGALVVVFFLDEQQQLKLIDFVYVILINLSVSLAVSLFFIPALLQRFPLPRPAETRRRKNKQRLVKRYNTYLAGINVLSRFRVWVFVLALLGFGLPTFMMPNQLKSEHWYQKSYNTVFGNTFYQETMRPIVDKALGGSLRLFLKETKQLGLGGSSRRTQLTISGDMYEGTTLEQTNEIFKRLENKLTGYDEIEQFQTYIRGTGNSTIQVFFKPEHEFTSFPSSLKSEMESKVVDMGVGDWSITGVGRGFDNSLHEGRRNSRVTFYGYNLEQLKGYAHRFKEYLQEIQRVDAKSIFINGRATRNDQVHREHIIDLNEKRLSQAGIGQGNILYELRKLSRNETAVTDLYNNGVREPVRLKRADRSIPDNWEFYHKALPVGKDKIARMDFFGTLKKERVTDLINKENMEYTMVVEFDFIGSYGQKEYLVGRVIKKMADELPIGYRLKQQIFYGGAWGNKSDKDNRLFILILILAIIFGICAIVFESLRQPFMVLVMIPLSFIGVFLTFYLFDVPFGQGGYAALLLLSGLTVNAALYIINDLNAIRRRYQHLDPLRAYVYAFRQKIVPIMLTIFSTVLGLIPFLFGGEKDVFWYSLALGTMGGLLFSLVALVVVLPLMVRKRKTEHASRS